MSVTGRLPGGTDKRNGTDDGTPSKSCGPDEPPSAELYAVWRTRTAGRRPPSAPEWSCLLHHDADFDRIAAVMGVDATTLEANAAVRSIVRRDDGTAYDEFLGQLAVTSGIETPTRQDLAKLDRKRPEKGSNKDWKHPHDPEARITRMKDGSTRLAHKLEQAVDMETGAVVATTVQTMDGGGHRVAGGDAGRGGAAAGGGGGRGARGGRRQGLPRERDHERT